MLRAISDQQQTNGRRLWFNDQDHDLFVWLDEQQKPLAFQFSYHTRQDEYCIHWHRQRGFSHDRIDSGDTLDGHYKMTPVLMPDGEFEGQRLAEIFQSVCKDIDAALAQFIYRTLAAAGNH